MPRIVLTTRVRAPAARCFDLARSVEAHVHSTAVSGERAVAGVTTGLLALGDEVTWEARHFGVRQRLSSRIVAFDRPAHFRDAMTRGAFARFDHDHFFSEAAEAGSGDASPVTTVTTMRDVFDYAAPLGPLGAVAERLFLTAYLERFLRERAAALKRLAESEAWRAYLPDAD